MANKDELQKLIEENRRLRNRLEELEIEVAGSDAGKNSDQLRLAELIIDNSPAILFRRRFSDDPKKRKMVYVSPNISRFGYSADDFLTNRIMFRDIVYKGDSDRTLGEIQEFVDHGDNVYSQYYRIVTKSGEVRWVEDRTSIYKDERTGEKFHQGIVVDIHEQKSAEEALARSEEKYRRIVESTGEGFVLMDEACRIVDCNSAFEGLVGRPGSQLRGEEFTEFKNNHTQALSGQSFECVLQNVDGGEIPVLIHTNTLFSDSDQVIGNMAFIADLTQQKKALQLAAEVQAQLLPREPPEVPGLDIAGRSISCDEVGGDYFDYLIDPQKRDGDVTVAIGDITGHGVEAALLMSSARAALRMRAFKGGPITGLVSAVNKQFIEDVGSSGRFMTLCYMRVSGGRTNVEWVRAGHEPALLYDPDLGEFHELKGPGLALGVMPDFAYERQLFEGLKENQLIVLTTDGVFERANKKGELFGKESLKNVIRCTADQPAEKIVAALFDALDEFADGHPVEDDVTVVIIKIVPTV